MTRFRSCLALFALAISFTDAHAAIIVIGNYTLESVPLTFTGPDQKSYTVTLASFQLAPVPVAGGVDVSFPTRGEAVKLRLDPFHAYVLMVDQKKGIRLEGIQLVGEPLPEDLKPGEGPPPKLAPVKIPVTLYVDDADPRTERIWKPELRKRFDEAADTIERHSGIRFEFKDYGTWKSDPGVLEPAGMLEDFEKKVSPKPGEVAIGYTSRKVEDKGEMPFGACRGVLGTHVLMRESRPRNESERVEALTHFLAQIAGASFSIDPESVMRPNIANGLAVNARYKVRFDPLNTLAMSLWADELRRGPRTMFADVSPANRARLVRVYKAMAAALPEDQLAARYSNELENAAIAVRPKANPNPKMPNDPPAIPRPTTAGRTPRQEAVRQVVQAIAVVADANQNDTTRLRGDELFEAYVRAAAEAAWGVEEQFRSTAFFVGLGIALDDAGLLRSDPQTAPFVHSVESENEWQRRQTMLGMPTLKSRRDLIRRFATAGAATELLGAAAAEDACVQRAIVDVAKPPGFSFPALAADLAGIELSQQLRGSPELMTAWRKNFRGSNYLPPFDGLRDGVSRERFDQDFGGGMDGRFTKVVDEIHNRVAKVPGYRN